MLCDFHQITINYLQINPNQQDLFSYRIQSCKKVTKNPDVLSKPGFSYSVSAFSYNPKAAFTLSTKSNFSQVNNSTSFTT